MSRNTTYVDDDEAYPVTGLQRWSGVGRFAFYMLLLLALSAGYALLQFRGLREPAAMESAQIARNMAEGQGFVTDCVRPFDLWYLQERGVLPTAPASAVPVLWMAPGWPALQSVFFRLVSPHYTAQGSGAYLVNAETRIIVPLGIGFFLLTVLAVWLLARTLFGDRVALPAAAAYAVSDLALSASISGLAVPAATLLTVLTVLFVVLAVRRSTVVEKGWGVAALTLAGALCAAAAVLTDYTMLVVALGGAVLLGAELQRRRWLMLTLYLLVLGLLLAPWLMRNHESGIGVAGALPYSTLRDTPLFQNDSLERSVAPAFNAYRSAAAVRQGFAGRLARMASGGGLIRGGVMFCFFILALFHRYEQAVCRALKGVTVLALVALALFPLMPGAESGGGWVALYPLMVLLGMSAFFVFLDREDIFDAGMKPLLTALLLLLCMLPAGLRMVGGAAAAYPPYYAPIQCFAGSIPHDGEALLTDVPWATAWYGRCTSILLPVHPDDVAALPGGGWSAIGGLYLTAPQQGSGDLLWTMMLLGRQVPESVPFEHGVNLPVGRTDQLLLTRDDRWAP